MNKQKTEKTLRPAVRKYLAYWQRRLQVIGAEKVKRELEVESLTKFLDKKDRMQLLRELGLREMKVAAQVPGRFKVSGTMQCEFTPLGKEFVEQLKSQCSHLPEKEHDIHVNGNFGKPYA